MMKRFNHVFLLILMALTVFNACEKDELETTNVETSEIFEGVSKHMLSFDSFKQFQDEADRVANFTVEELKEWEQEKGFKSFGSYSDDLIDFISEENFKSETEADTYIKLNSDFIETTIDSTVEPKLMLTPYRYLVNAEQKCSIGGKVVVLRDNGIFIDASQNTEKIGSDTLVFFGNKSSRGYITDGYAEASYDDRKMKVWLSLHIFTDPYGYAYQVRIQTSTYNQVTRWGKKVWKLKRHIHKVSASVSLQYLENGTWKTVRGNDYYEKERKTYYYNDVILIGGYQQYQVRYSDVYISASFAGLHGRKAIISN